MVEVRNLKKYYGKGENLVKAVDHTDLDIESIKHHSFIILSIHKKSLTFS